MRYDSIPDGAAAVVKEELTVIDMDERYRQMLNDCYSFDQIGGPFAYMSADRVLEEMDPVAYRCGFNDWLDGEEVWEIDGEYYDEREVENILEDIENREKA